MIHRGDLKNRRWIRVRLQAVGVIFVLVCLVLWGRAAYLQLFEHDHLKRLAGRELMKRIKMHPRRGIIFDRNQDELAVSVDTDSVFASPVRIKTPKSTGRALAGALNLPRSKVVKALSGEKRFVWIARRISPQKAAKVKSLNLKGVGILKEPKRIYPFTSLASHVLGFAGDEAKGLEGLEKGYDNILRGQAHTVISQRDALGRTIHLTQEAFTMLPEGDHLVLTLDKGLQYQVEKILAKTVSYRKAKSGQAIVMVPQTGEILAMASWPSFNPNVFGRYPRSQYRNRLVEDVYEPGSTFKLFVAAGALQSGKVLDGQLIDCEDGKWKVGGRVIHDTHPHGELDLAGIVKVSSNIGIAKVGFAVGAKALAETFKSFGFGKRTGIDLPGESPGILRSPNSWRPVDLANICFGQGIAVTTLQLAQAVAAIANGGVMMKPYVVKAVLGHDMRIKTEINPKVVRRVLSEGVARRLTGMMMAVTEEGGTAQRVKVEPFGVAGKTGTAQKVKPGGGYSHRDYIASFVGFLPALDPKVVVLVVIDTPKKGYYGSTVAGPAFVQIAKAALNNLGVSWSGPDIRQAARPGAQAKAEQVIKPVSSEKIKKSLDVGVTPDFRGQTLRSVLGLTADNGIRVKADGWGRVVSQYPQAGDPVAMELELTLKPVGEGA